MRGLEAVVPHVRGGSDSETGVGGRVRERVEEGQDAGQGLRGGELGPLERSAFGEELVVGDGELSPGLKGSNGLIRRM